MIAIVKGPELEEEACRKSVANFMKHFEGDEYADPEMKWFQAMGSGKVSNFRGMKEMLCGFMPGGRKDRSASLSPARRTWR